MSILHLTQPIMDEFAKREGSEILLLQINENFVKRIYICIVIGEKHIKDVTRIKIQFRKKVFCFYLFYLHVHASWTPYYVSRQCDFKGKRVFFN